MSSLANHLLGSWLRKSHNDLRKEFKKSTRLFAGTRGQHDKRKGHQDPLPRDPLQQWDLYQLKSCIPHGAINDHRVTLGWWKMGWGHLWLKMPSTASFRSGYMVLMSWQLCCDCGGDTILRISAFGTTGLKMVETCWNTFKRPSLLPGIN